MISTGVLLHSTVHHTGVLPAGIFQQKRLLYTYKVQFPVSLTSNSKDKAKTTTKATVVHKDAIIRFRTRGANLLLVGQRKVPGVLIHKRHSMLTRIVTDTLESREILSNSHNERQLQNNRTRCAAPFSRNRSLLTCQDDNDSKRILGQHASACSFVHLFAR